MKTELTLDIVQSQLRPQQRLMVDEKTVNEVKKLAEDPEYGQEFLDTYLDHLNVFKENSRRSHDQYLSAVKFFSLVEAGNSLTDAYIKTFPERYTARKRNHDPEDRKKDIMRGEASRYNSSVLVNEIRKVAAIPVQLIHRHILHEAIIEQANLMRTARSEMVKQKAAACLIAELKPSEDHVLNVKVEDGTTSMIDQLRNATEKLAAAELQRVKAGVPLKDIAESKIIDGEAEEIEDADFEEIQEEEPVDEAEKKRWSLG